MSKYIKRFTNHNGYTAYTADTENYLLPNVSYCVQENEAHMKPYSDPRVVAKYNVTSTTSPTNIGYVDDASGFSEIEIDGVEQPFVADSYTFDTLGEHTVKYTLTDPTSICRSAFTFCYNLASITIPSGVTSIGDAAFYACYSLASITIPSGVTSIGNDAFFRCSGLTSITIPSGVTNIGYSAFTRCYSLASVTFGEDSQLTSIMLSTFAYCSGLTSINIPSGVTFIGQSAFTDCYSLASATFAEDSKLTRIEDNAFCYCIGLASVTIPSGVTSIGRNAFYGCSSLTSVTCLPTTPPMLGIFAFTNNANGRKIYVPSESETAYEQATVWSEYASDIEPIP